MIDIDQAALDLEAYAKQNGSTAERGIEQKNGSIVVLTSVKGAKCTRKTLSTDKDRVAAGWPLEAVK